MDAVQRPAPGRRRRSNLKTNEQQTVTVAGNDGATGIAVIRVDPSQPPCGVRPNVQPDGGVWCVALSALRIHPIVLSAGVCGRGGVAFTAGVALGAAWGYAWGGCNWGSGDVDIDVNRNTNFNQNINRENYRA